MPTIQRFCVHLLEMWPTKHLAQVLAENSFSVTVFMDGPEKAGRVAGERGIGGGVSDNEHTELRKWKS